MIKKVWQNFNVSTVVVLPLFNYLTKNVYFKSPTKEVITTTVFPFNQLCIEYGLIDCFLYKDMSKKFDGNLYLVFDKKRANKNLNITNSVHHCIIDFIVNFKETEYIKFTKNVVILGIRIPEEYHNDIKLIEESKYSEVSENYKMGLKIKNSRVPKIDGLLNSLGSYINIKDLGYAIVIKANHIKKSLEEALDQEINSENEFYIKFKGYKEVLNYLLN